MWNGCYYLFFFYCMTNNDHPGHSLICRRNCSRPLSRCSLIMEGNCEQCHCAECMRPVFPRETKGPSVAERATVQCHHSDSVGAHTQLLRPRCCCCGWQITQGTVGAMPEIKRRWKPVCVGERTAGTKLHWLATKCFSNPSIFFSHCRNCWIRFFTGATADWLTADEDMTKPAALHNRLMKWTLTLLNMS